jgi:hypothetical protein
MPMDHRVHPGLEHPFHVHRRDRVGLDQRQRPDARDALANTGLPVFSRDGEQPDSA